MLAIHGDWHDYIVDQPLTSRATDRHLSNVTRLQVPGSFDVGWVRVTFTSGSEEPFRLRASGGSRMEVLVNNPAPGRTSRFGGEVRNWLARAAGLLSSLFLLVLCGFGVLGAFMGSYFGGSLAGFLALVCLTLLVGATLGYWLTRLGQRKLPGILAMGLCYVAPVALAMMDLGGPSVLVPVLPLLLVSVVVGGRGALTQPGQSSDHPALHQSVGSAG